MALLEALHRFLWGLTADWTTLVGLFLTLGLQFLPLRQLPRTCLDYLRTLRHRGTGPGEISSLAAHMTSLGGILGVGHLSGMAITLNVGGPGVVPWMWVVGLLGLATKHAETFLAVRFRQPGPRGLLVGGPVEVIRAARGPRWEWLALLTAALGCLGVFGAGNGVQARQLTSGLSELTGQPPLLLAMLAAALIGWMLQGGLPRIGRLSALLVPLMVISWLALTLVGLAGHAGAVGEAVQRMLNEAFTPRALAGGGLALTLRTAVLMSVFTTETGMGTTAIAHAAASPADPALQGRLAGIGNLISLLVCTATALLLLVSGVLDGVGVPDGDGLNDSGATALLRLAWSRCAPGGDWLVCLALALFAFTTLLSFGHYGERFATALLGSKARHPFQLLWLLAIVISATPVFPKIWGISQVLDALMVLPNLLLLLLLSNGFFHAVVGRSPLKVPARAEGRHP